MSRFLYRQLHQKLRDTGNDAAGFASPMGLAVMTVPAGHSRMRAFFSTSALYHRPSHSHCETTLLVCLCIIFFAPYCFLNTVRRSFGTPPRSGIQAITFSSRLLYRQLHQKLRDTGNDAAGFAFPMGLAVTTVPAGHSRMKAFFSTSAMHHRPSHSHCETTLLIYLIPDSYNNISTCLKRRRSFVVYKTT